MNGATTIRFGVAACLVILARPPWLLGQDARSLEAIKPPDVFAHVELVRRELELLRAFMGRPKDDRNELPVSGAAPREVFFQAQTLFRKADRMCFEQTRTRAQQQPLAPPAGTISAGHVYAAVDAALQRIRLVKQHLDIQDELQPSLPDLSRTPSDVFRSIVQANRQLNLLLERQFSPSDVYQQVTVAIAHAERLVEHFPEADSAIPAAPQLERNRVPADVYRRLLGCFRVTQKISEQSGREALKLDEISQSEIEQATPSDVYDIASLVVAELAYLHGELPDSKLPRKAYYPGRKFPSHVFQRVAILEKQLGVLHESVTANPAWLSGSTSTATE